jgi:muramidase (phage lysozyme)
MKINGGLFGDFSFFAGGNSNPAPEPRRVELRIPKPVERSPEIAPGPPPAQLPPAWLKTPEALALLDTIASTESRGYDEMFTNAHDFARLHGPRRFTDYSSHPDSFEPFDSSLSKPPGQRQGSRAAGRYQFTTKTWNDEQSKLGLRDFSPDSQDRAAWDLASTTYSQRTGRSLSDDLKQSTNLPGIAAALNGQWASLPGGSQARTDVAKFRQTYDDSLTRRMFPRAIDD